MLLRESGVVLLIITVCVCAGTLWGAGNFEALSEIKQFSAGRFSSYDRSGGNEDFLRDVATSATLAEIEGAGAITHIWVTIDTNDLNHLRNIILRMYWDGESNPSVETPLGDFFGLGHAVYYHYSSAPISIGTYRGMNCFWFMPFSSSARITITNESEIPIHKFYYYVDYRSYPTTDTAAVEYLDSLGRFHASYNQDFVIEKGSYYTILDAEGEGHYVGCNLSVELNSTGWWGEGDDRIYIDGEEIPSLIGTGSEDYFCGAWCYAEAFFTPYFGCPLRGMHELNALWNVYR